MFAINKKSFLLGTMSVLMAGLFSASAPEAQAQTGAYPAKTQTFSITADANRWNQPYTWDYTTNSGNIGIIRKGSSSNVKYDLVSSYDYEEAYANFVAVFIYDYTVQKWVEALYVVDGSHYNFPGFE